MFQRGYSRWQPARLMAASSARWLDNETLHKMADARVGRVFDRQDGTKPLVDGGTLKA